MDSNLPTAADWAQSTANKAIDSAQFLGQMIAVVIAELERQDLLSPDAVTQLRDIVNRAKRGY